MKSGPNSATLNYDALLRLYQSVGGGVTTRFLYDGGEMIAEYNAANALQRRYVPGPDGDEPIVWYQGSVLTDRRWLHADERGSIISVSDGTGTAMATNRYDEYGIPASTNVGRFGYTGQTWLPEIGLNYYKTRIYSPLRRRHEHVRLCRRRSGEQDRPEWQLYVLCELHFFAASQIFLHAQCRCHSYD